MSNSELIMNECESERPVSHCSKPDLDLSLCSDLALWLCVPFVTVRSVARNSSLSMKNLVVSEMSASITH